MNYAAEAAFCQLLTSDAALNAAIEGRCWWDELELDPPYPAIGLRLLSSPVTAQLADHSDLRNPLVELSAYASGRRAASELLDLATAALRPYHNRTSVVVGSPAVTVRFASIRLIDVQQSPAPRDGTYRKVGLFSVWQEG